MVEVRDIASLRLDEVGGNLPELRPEGVVLRGPFILGPIPFSPIVNNA